MQLTKYRLNPCQHQMDRHRQGIGEGAHADAINDFLHVSLNVETDPTCTLAHIHWIALTARLFFFSESLAEIWTDAH